MWTLVHPLDIRWITGTIQDILVIAISQNDIISVGHPWDKVCCVRQNAEFLINSLKFIKM